MLFLGMLTGILVSAGMTHKIPADGRIMLGSHLNAILGAFMLFGYALSLAHLKYELKTLRLIGNLLVLANFSNWLITAIKAFPGVHGIDFDADPVNNVVFVALTFLVVLPTLAATGLWFFGFVRGGAASR